MKANILSCLFLLMFSLFVLPGLSQIDTTLQIGEDTIVEVIDGKEEIYVKDETKNKKWKQLEKHLDNEPDQTKNFSFIALPVIKFTPETDWTFGGNTSFYFRNPKVPDSKLSSVSFVAAYTLNKQYWIRAYYDLFLVKNKLWLDGEFRYESWLEQYYGVGNTNLGDFDIITYKHLVNQLRVVYQISNTFYLGAQFRSARLKDLEFPEDGIMDEEQVTGSLNDGFRSRGFGAAMVWDSRESDHFPNVRLVCSYLVFQSSRVP